MFSRRIAIAISLLTLVSAAFITRAEAATPKGEFVSVCAYSHSLMDDPIVAPSLRGASHLHDFFGNPTTDAFSTMSSLTATQTRCSMPGDTASYWIPSVLQNGVPVQARVARVYYRQSTKDARAIRPFPAGLRVIAGDSKATSPQPSSVAAWACSVNGDEVEVADVPTCSPDSPLRLRIIFPDCWNGVSLDSPDHKSHMAYSARQACPASHPVPVPRIVLSIRFRTTGGPGLTLSSGGQYSGHADFFNSWNQTGLSRLVNRCIRASVKCGEGDSDRIPDLATFDRAMTVPQVTSMSSAMPSMTAAEHAAHMGH